MHGAPDSHEQLNQQALVHHNVSMSFLDLIQDSKPITAAAAAAAAAVAVLCRIDGSCWLGALHPDPPEPNELQDRAQGLRWGTQGHRDRQVSVHMLLNTC